MAAINDQTEKNVDSVTSRPKGTTTTTKPPATQTLIPLTFVHRLFHAIGTDASFPHADLERAVDAMVSSQEAYGNELKLNRNHLIRA
jgi:hypothetical protein